LKIAIAEWNGRIAPVFDVTDRAMLLDWDGNRLVNEEQVALPEGEPHHKILFLRNLGVEELICGAISCHVRAEAEGAGMKVHGFIAGDYREIIDAWRQNRLPQDRYAMPGCGRHRCCGRHRRDANDEKGRWN